MNSTTKIAVVVLTMCASVQAMPYEQFLTKFGHNQVRMTIGAITGRLSQDNDWVYRYIYYSDGWVNQVAVTSFSLRDKRWHYSRYVFNLTDKGGIKLVRGWRGTIPKDGIEEDWDGVIDLEKQTDEKALLAMNLQFRLIQKKFEGVVSGILLPADPVSVVAWNNCFIEKVTRNIIRDIEAGNAAPVRAAFQKEGQ